MGKDTKNRKKLIIPLINMKHLINAPFQMNKTPKQRQLDILVFFSYPEKKISGWIEDIGLKGWLKSCFKHVFLVPPKNTFFLLVHNFLNFWSWIKNLVSRITYATRAVHFWGFFSPMTRSGVPLGAIYTSRRPKLTKN